MSAQAVTQLSDKGTRCRIVETAERFFRDIGYQKTTVADIAKALKMSPANVYRFFESKKSINEAVAERLMREVEGAIDNIAARKEPAVDRLRDMITTMHRMNTALYTDHQRMHEMVEAALVESWAVVHGHIERKAAIFEKVVREGAQAGELDLTDPESASKCLQTCLMRFFHPVLIVACAHEETPSLDMMIDFVLTALGYRKSRAAMRRK